MGATVAGGGIASCPGLGLPFGPMRIAPRIAELAPSSTIVVTSRARALKAQGVDVIGFGVGEPDFDTPQFIRDAATSAMNAGHTHYVTDNGTLPARKAIVSKLHRDNGLTWVTPEHVIITAGGKQGYYMLLHSLVDPLREEEVLIPTPAWVSYDPIARLAGGKVVLVPTTMESGFKMSPAQLRAALTPRSRALVVNSPSNPTGGMYTPDELRALAKVVTEHNDAGGDLIVVTDDIYEKLIYTETPFATIAEYLDPAHVAVINGLSKAYAMTGWRTAYVASDKAIVDALNRLQGQINTCITAFAYPAIAEALEHGEESVRQMGEVYRRRAHLTASLIDRWPDCPCPALQGAFYAFPDVSAYFGTVSPQGRAIRDSVSFAEALLMESHVAVVPGDDFGPPGERHIRISYACSERDIETGLTRIEAFLRSLRKT